MNRSLAMLASIILLGCGGDENRTSLEGVYEITAWTENPDSCDAEGPSVLPHPFGTTHFYVKNESFFGESFVNVVGCEGVANCQEEAVDTTFDLSFFGPLVTGSDEAGWRNDDSSCGGGFSIEYPELLMRPETEGLLFLEAQIKSLDDPPRDDEDFLDCEAGFAQVADLPCEKLEVVRGTLVDTL
jgi:hypothetical protein